jgi:hypothetical protein
MWTIVALVGFPALSLTLYWIADRYDNSLPTVVTMTLLGPGLLFAQAIGVKGIGMVTIASTIPVVVLGYLADSRQRGKAAWLGAAILLGMGAWFVMALAGLGALVMRGP